MNEYRLDRDLRDIFAAGPGTPPTGIVDRALAEARTLEQRRPPIELLDARAWPPKARSIADPMLRRSLQIVLVAVAIVLSVAAVIAIGSLLWPRVPPELIPAGELPSSIRGPIAIVLPDGRVLVRGQGPATIFDPRTGTSVAANLGPLVSPIVLTLPDGRLIVLGSTDDTGTGPTEVGILDPTSRRTTVIGELPTHNFSQQVAALPDGRLLIAGGADISGGGFVALASVHLFDPASGASSELGPMLQPRVRQEMVVLGDGRVLIVGGEAPVQGDDSLDVELYDVALGRSEAVGTVHRSATWMSSPTTRLADGRVLIAGAPILDHICGDMTDPSGARYPVAHEEAYVFDPATGGLAKVQSVAHGGQGVATADGRVAVFGSYITFPGGCESAVPPTSQLWLGVYDPATGVTLETTNPSTGTGTLPFVVRHDYATGVLLPDGRIALVADDEGVPRNAVDLFTVGN
jgi:hypothetical protein